MKNIRYVIVLIIGVVFPSISLGLEVRPGMVDGTWKIVQMGNSLEEGTDFWEFQDNRFTQNLGGHRMASDGYTIKGDTLDMGYASITVLEMGGDRMKAKYGPVTYVLKKVSDKVDVTPTPQKEITPETQQQAEEFLQGAASAVDASSELNCQRAVKNSHEGLDTMLGVGEKNYRDGYIPKDQYEKTSAQLKSMMASITLSDCEASSGGKRDFYRCMSNDMSMFIGCAQKFL